MKLITHSHLVLILMSGILPLFPLFDFLAWTGIILLFTSHNGLKFALLTRLTYIIKEKQIFPIAYSIWLQYHSAVSACLLH